MLATVISYPNNEINYSIDFDTTLNSFELIQCININVADATTDDYIEVSYNGEVITLYVTEECRYTPIDIAFINKQGAQQVLTFFKAKSDSMSVTDETFESDRGQPNLGHHQFVRYNVNAKSSFNINSGFVDEDLNETFKQLFLSERIWLVSNGLPLNIKSKQLQYKTRQNDRLISYEVEFEYAYNEINNI